MGVLRRVYGIDLDGVCFDFPNDFRDYINVNTGLGLEAEEITSYYWYETIERLSNKVFWEEFHKFGHDGGYRRLNLIPGALEALRAIVKAGHRIVYVTNRPAYVYRDTVDALAEHHFPFAANLEFTSGPKSPVIRDLGIDVFIDDSPANVADLCANTDIRVYCMDYPMNRAIHDVRLYTRVKSWSEFLRAEGISG